MALPRAGGSEKKSKGRFSTVQILKILKAHGEGTTVRALCTQYGFSPTTFYKWRTKFAGATFSEPASEKAKIAELEEENCHLKKLLGETVLENATLKKLLVKHGE